MRGFSVLLASRRGTRLRQVEGCRRGGPGPRDRLKNVIFGFFGIGKFSFLVLELFKISRKLTCKLKLSANSTVTRDQFSNFWVTICCLDIKKGWIKGLKVKRGHLRSNHRPKKRFSMTHSSMSHETIMKVSGFFSPGF